MEISKFISDALKDGSLDKVSKGIEQLVIMMINAIGMIEKRELEFEKRIETLEEDMDLIKSFLLSNPVPIPKSSTPVSSPSQQYPEPTGLSQFDQPPPTGIAPSSDSSSPSDGQISSEHKGPQEEDILSFRKKLLKPTPKEEKAPAAPVSIRAALMQEIRNYIGTSVDETKKDDMRKKIIKTEKKQKS